MKVMIVTAAVWVAIGGLSLATAANAAVTHFNLHIPREPLDAALRDLARQTGVEVGHFSDQAQSGLLVGPVQGSLSPADALGMLLHSTGLSYRALNDRAYIVATPAALASAGESAQGGAGGTGNGAGATNPSSNDSSVPAGKEGKRDTSGGFRSAQTASTGDQSPSKQDGSAQAKEKNQKLQEVVVTGTHIRGTPVKTSPVIQIDRAAIARSGYSNTSDLIASIPQMFGGGSRNATPDGNLGAGSNANSNNEHATAANLRGLGENATLVLLNGHRMAASDYGNVVDISTIPLLAIDHIDILTDGASAIYGADAVAGVVNIVLRKDTDGAETDASYGGAQGGLKNGIFSQSFAKSWGTGSLMGTYEYNRETGLPTSARPFTAGASQPTNIINPYTENSFVLNGDQQFGSQFTVYGDSLLTWKHTTNVYATGPSDQFANYSDPSAINAHLGATYFISQGWAFDLNGTYARQATNVGFTNYPVSIILNRDTIAFRDSTSQFDATVNGRLFSTPGGDVKVAFGASQRTEDAKETVSDPYWLPDLAFSRHVTAEFAELYLPLVGANNSLPLVQRLAVSAAVRHDHYSDFGSTTNPKVGLVWSPISDLQFKANWSTAFRPPSVGEQLANNYEGPMIFRYVFANPTGSGTVPVFILGGRNPDLRPETATNFNIGFDYSPSAVPGLTLSLDHYAVNFKNRIVRPPFDLNALLHPSVYGPLIGSLPTDAAAAAFLADYEAQGYLFTDLTGSGAGATGVRYTYLNQLINAAVVRQAGFDLTAQYLIALGMESFRTGLNLAYIDKIDTQYAPGATVTDVVNAYSNPLKLRFRADETWTHGPAELTAAVNFDNAYTNPYSVPTASIGSFTTVDLSAAVHLGLDDHPSLLRGTTIRLNAINVFNAYPPYAAGNTLSGVNYDVGNASPIGRFLSVEFQKKW